MQSPRPSFTTRRVSAVPAHCCCVMVAPRRTHAPFKVLLHWGAADKPAMLGPNNPTMNARNAARDAVTGESPSGPIPLKNWPCAPRHGWSRHDPAKSNRSLTSLWPRSDHPLGLVRPPPPLSRQPPLPSLIALSLAEALAAARAD